MANYHMSIKIFSRGKGASAVQKAAYRSGEVIKSDYDGETHDYTRKSGIIHKDILLPENAPVEYKKRSVLWNAVEKSERFVNAQLAREIEISLPVELSKEQNIALARKFVDKTFVKDGMCADICVHDNGTGNPHAHIMLTMRPIEKDGSWGQKSRTVDGQKIPSVDWNEREKAEYWRKQWAKYQNATLEEQGHKARVDHRSFQRQGKEHIPTVHLGSAAHMERKGIRTEQGDRNREIEQWNRELRQIRARLKKLKNWLYNQPIEDMPTMSDVMMNINTNQDFKTKAQKLTDFHRLVDVHNFMVSNNVYSFEQLADKLSDMHQEQYDIAGELKKQERRISTLDVHLHNASVYNQTKAIYRKLIKLDPKKQTAFKHQHAVELQQYEASHKYLKDHLNGKTIIPEKAWKKEREKLCKERYNLAERYYELKDDIKVAEAIRRGAERVMGDVVQEQQYQQHTRTQDWEL